jgi:hypothetical protein
VVFNMGRIGQRRYQRWPADLDVGVTDLAYPDQTAHGRIVDLSQSGIRVRISMRVDPAATVKLEIANCTLFGHAIHCREYTGAYEIGIEIVRVLVGSPDLGQLLKAVLAESTINTPDIGVVEEAAELSLVQTCDTGDC